MTSENATSPTAIPSPEEHNSPPPQDSLNSVPISAVPPFSPQATTEGFANSAGVVSNQTVDEIEEPSYYKYLDSKEYGDKYKRYLSEFKQYLMAKYFSGRDPNGVNLFQETTTIDGETIKSSKWPCTRWYAGEDVSCVDPVQCLDEEEEDEVEDEEEEEEQEDEEEDEEEEESRDLGPAELITPGEISNGGIVSEKTS
ncbi:unnamed protein product [Microthlaspi erraticum]|uniref:Uncharacterized protein n=1 Tax=Microthlaspi erraticum TaxID=1685480 RepID=A0A6D2IBX0_9BRAS|nr:unnamed protein product [Microthlaspi erraticum]